MAAGRLDEALSLLQSEREKTPSDREVAAELELVRERVAEQALKELGPLELVPTPQLGSSAMALRDGLDLPTRYVLERVDGVRTLDAILRFSALGRARTAQTLVVLFKAGAIELPGRRRIAPAAVSPEPLRPSPSAGALTSSGVHPLVQSLVVVVADASSTQAALTRTLLRVATPRAVDAHTVASGRELFDALRRLRPALLVVDFGLPDADGCDAVMRARSLAPDVPAIVLATSLDLELARSRLPTQKVVLVRRPFDKATLASAMGALLE